MAAPPGATDGQSADTAEDQAEWHHIDATRQKIANRIERQSHQLRATLVRLHAARGVVAAEVAHLDAANDAEALAGLTLQGAALAARKDGAVGRIACVETELSNRNLFAV